MPRNVVAVELFYGGGWHDLVPADDVLAEPIKIMRGDSDEVAAPRPAQVDLRLANDDDMYRTSNPESPLYGKAGVNTPLRVSVGGKVRGQVEANAWTAGQSRDFRAFPKRGSAWVDVEAGGLLQRVNQWTELLASPLYQYDLDHYAADWTGLWPMDDPRGTTVLRTPVPGAYTDTARLSFESQLKPPGTGPLADVNNGAGRLKVFTDPAKATIDGGYQVGWLHFQAKAGTAWEMISWVTHDGHTVALDFDDVADTLTIFVGTISPLATVVTQTVDVSGYNFLGRWMMWVVEVSESGGTVTVGLSWRAVDDPPGWTGFSATYSGVTSSPKYIELSTIVNVDRTMGELITVNGVSNSLKWEERFSAFLGYADETAADRFARLCNQRNIAYSIVGTAASSYPMGPQPVASFPDHLREIRDTEDGLLFDAIDAVELVLMLRGARYNQTPALTLRATDLPVLPPEVTDDLPIHNIVTVAQRDGGDFTLEDSISPMGSQPPPAGRGEYRQRVDVNIPDEAIDLPLLAGYRLNRGTVNLPRFPQVTVNLAALDAATIAEVEAVDIGSVITIDGYREYTIRLYVIGYTETIGWPTARSIVFTCAPDQPFRVATLDTDLADSGSTVLKASLNISDTAATFRSTDIGDVWNTTTPYEVYIAGQRCRVTSMGAAALVSGAYDQAATLVRGVDGVRKGLAANEPITVADPARCAL